MTSSSTATKKKWNVLVYLAGDNNLSADMVWSLQEMMKAARNRGVREALDLSVLFDPAGSNPRRTDLIANGQAPGHEEEGDGHLGDLPALDYPEGTDVSKIVARFLGERLRALPRAAHRLVVLSGHGSGSAGNVLPDDDPETSLSIPALGKLLHRTRQESGESIDVLGFDSCEMSGIEVAYELRGAARYLVASEGLVLDAGWPYHRFVEAVAARSQEPPLELAREIARRYLAFYRDYDLIGLSTDVSVTELERLEPVAGSVSALASAMSAPLARLAADGLEEAIELGHFRRWAPDTRVGDEEESARVVRNAILLAHWSAQSYRGDRYADLFDFAEQLVRFTSNQPGDEIETIRTAAASVLDAVGTAVAYSGSTGADFQHSHGLSIYFPWSASQYVAGYRHLSFSKTTGWADFLEVYLRATLRLRRDQVARVDKAEREPGLALDAAGNAVLPVEPRRRPDVSLPAKDVDSGTHKGRSCKSTMKNPPDGYYDRSSIDRGK